MGEGKDTFMEGRRKKAVRKMTWRKRQKAREEKPRDHKDEKNRGGSMRKDKKGQGKI